MIAKHSLFKVIGPCYFADEGGYVGSGGTGGAARQTVSAEPTPAAAAADDPMYSGGSSDNGNSIDDGGNSFNFDEFKNTYAKEYLDKPYMQAIDSPERLFKEFDNTQNLIGKKLSIPGPEATDKEQDEYLDLIRPKDKSVYKIPDAHLPENLKGFHNAEFEEKIIDLFQQAALTPKQAAILSEGYDKLMLNANGEALAQYAEQQKINAMNDADYNALADKTWGSERETVQNVARALLQQFTPPEFKKGVDNLSNENLVVLASVLKGVSDKYISQDDLNTLKGAGHNTHSLDSLKSEAQSKMAALMSMSSTDPKYDLLQKEVSGLYTQIGKLSGDK